MVPPAKSSGAVPGRPHRGHFGPDDVRLGYISGVFGLAGHVRVYLYHPDGEMWADPVAVTFVAPDGAREVRMMQAYRGAGRRILAEVDGLSTPEVAQTWMNRELVVSRQTLPETDPGEDYHRDLLGLPVRTTAGRELGRLTEIYDTSGVDTWVVRGPDGETYLPAIREVVLSVVPSDHILVDDGFGAVL